MSEFLSDHMELFEDAKMCKHLSPSEEDFLQDLEVKYEQHGNATYISDKQIAWLERMIDRG